MNSTQVNEYFQRIGYTGSCTPTIETLRAIQAAHAHTIPFETFDIAMGRPIILQFDRLFTKIVTQKRGGYCYEVNALLYFVLQALGFTTHLMLARLDDAESVHMVLLVTLEKLWLVDVGWGPGFIEPFCLDTLTKENGDYSLYQNEKKLYRFTLEEYPLEFFETRNSYHQTSPHSPFATQIFCSLPTASLQSSTIKTDAEYRQRLLDLFGLTLAVNRPVLLEHEGFILHSPRNCSDWEAYHRIRFEQIHTRYCPELTYAFSNNPEEQSLNNFPLVFRKKDSHTILGTIRIDLLEGLDAAFRWIAIDAPYVRQGFGSKMLQIAEQFVQNRAKKAIRIPATAQSLAFAHFMGYQEAPWDLMPQEECMIGVYKGLESFQF